MTDPQRNKLAMYLAVLGVMNKYNSVWTTLTAIADIVTRLTGLTTAIQAASGVQGSPLTGIAGGKRRKRMEMMEQASSVAGDLHSYAVKQNDTSLAAKVSLQFSDLLRMPETEIAPRCQEIHDLANTNAAALAPYGTDAADITALQTAIDDFKESMTKPRQAVVGRKQVTGNIAHDETTADDLLKRELDRSMRKFAKKNPDFFGEYTTARMIIDLGSGGGKDEPPATPPPAP